MAVLLSVGMAGSPDARGISLIRDSELERTLRDMSRPIFQAAGLTPSTVEIFIVNDRSMNAFVVGGRRIFLNTGLIIDLETPEELLGVIAHETGHISGGHEARRQINLRNAQGPALLGLLIGIAAGAAGGGEAGIAAIAGSQGAVQRLLLRYNRAEEAAADQAALSYLERAQIDPNGLRKVLELFRGQEVLSIGNVDPYVLTHPLGTERMSLIERRTAVLAGRSWPEDANREYWHARMRAKLSGFLQNPQQVLARLEDEPDTEFKLYAEAVALHRLPDPDGALATVDRLIAKRPNDPFYIELKGQILLEHGRAKEAIPQYRRAMQLAPGEALIMARLGRSLLQLNQPAADIEALAILKDARSRDLADAAALRDLAMAYDRVGDRGMATLATAERYALNGNVIDAVRLARRAAAILPNGSPSWLRARDILALDTGED
ncbi:MAG: M48 family metalloprotease [Pseudomonadota bacterium]